MFTFFQCFNIYCVFLLRTNLLGLVASLWGSGPKTPEEICSLSSLIIFSPQSSKKRKSSINNHVTIVVCWSDFKVEKYKYVLFVCKYIVRQYILHRVGDSQWGVQCTMYMPLINYQGITSHLFIQSQPFLEADVFEIRFSPNINNQTESINH